MFARRLSLALALLLAPTGSAWARSRPAPPVASTPAPVEEKEEKRPVSPKVEAAEQRPMYTTYFFTAGEAVIHGYEEGTRVRVVSLNPAGTVWEGVVNAGQARTVQTGRGTFGFLSDKKASILVGTPSSCTVIGYFLKNREGSYLSNHFFGTVPRPGSPDDRLLVWAYEDTQVTITDRATGKQVRQQALKGGQYLELVREELQGLADHVLEFASEGPKVAVQVYYDEGFVVPARDGRAAGKLFYTYAGKTTNGVNDLVLSAPIHDARVKVHDLKTGELIKEERLERGQARAIPLAGRYVRVTSDFEIQVSVVPFTHYQGAYAEHHFAMGVEGTGIETEFYATTPQELWLFSYYEGTQVTVTDAVKGTQIYEGVLKAGQSHGLTPGQGFYRVRSSRGMSVMGGASSCGADYSPAAGMFAVDEALLKVLAQVREERKAAAQASGHKLSEAELNAPLSAAEGAKAKDAIKAATGRSNISLDEVNERASAIAR